MGNDETPESTCYSCARNQAEPAMLPPRERILVGDGWRAAHAVTAALPGWLVLVARRHVVSWADLTAVEASEFGMLTRRLSQALTVVLAAGLRRWPSRVDSGSVVT